MLEKFYYLHNYTPIIVHAEKRDGDLWYIPDLKLPVHESDLYTDLYKFLYHCLKIMAERKEEIKKEIKMLSCKGKPHPDAKPTKVPYLWVINNDRKETK